MKGALILSLAALLSLGVSAIAQTRPEPPSLWREVTGAVYTDPATTIVARKKPVHTAPHVPSFRTSRDGRIALRILTSAEFTLLMPEKLNAHVRLIPPATGANAANNSYVMSSPVYSYVDGVTAGESSAKFNSPAPGSRGGIGHFTLFDPTPTDPTAGEITNPRNVGGNDVYNLYVIAGYNYESPDPNDLVKTPGDPVNPGKTQFFVTPVEVVVENPKTTLASIKSITRTGPPVGGPIYPTNTGSAIREVNVVGGGRLIVFRTSRSQFSWTDPVSGVVNGPQTYEIVYSYYTPQQGSNPCDPTKWTTLIPISHAPFDSRINSKFGFAMNPFRDPAGTLIPDGSDIGGTYPWMDRDAKNLFFTVVGDTLRYRKVVGGVTTYTSSRYVQTPTAGELVDDSAEDASDTRGICFAGLWSHGKTVMIDNLNNDMDYAIGGNLYTRMVQLFDTSTVPLPLPNPKMNDWIKLGGGRVNSTPDMPPGDNRNSTILDSLENVFNYRQYAKPITVRDVVWPLHNAKHSDDLVFDEYVDHDAFIVANMTGLATFTPGSGYSYQSGWNSTTSSFSNTVKLQNAATPTTDRWLVPTHGQVVNSGTSKGRLEPIATGGIHGKGFWMDGNIGLQFTVVAQPQSVSGRDWYAGIFVDCRNNDDTTSRMLLSFPDGSKIRLLGRSQIQYVNAAGSLVKSIVLPAPNSSAYPDMLPDTGWAHLAWQIRKGGALIEFLLNGLIYDRSTSAASLFQLTPGQLIVGKNSAVSNPGFTGWIDDFIVLAHTVDPETACNHAGGTLVGLPAGYTGPMADLAARYPGSTHTEISNRLQNSGETSYPSYANFYSYTKDYGAHLGNIPAGAVSLRQSIHFPEGPIYYNAPRPDSTKNSFCITCHSDQGKGGLDLMALELSSGLPANQDDRRQPSQPFRRLFGNIPAGLVQPSIAGVSPAPAALTALPASGQIIDDWIQPAFVKATVKSFTLVDASNNVDLTPLKDGDTVSLAAYGASSYTIRANLDSAQRSVTLTFDSGVSATPDRIPYSINLPTLSPGFHTVTATPLPGGAPVTIGFNVQGVATNLQAWRTAHFFTTANTGTAADTADPDGDAWTNAAEYVLGTSPTSPSNGSPLSVARSGANLTLTFTANAATGPGYTSLTRIFDVETTTNLANAASWTGVASYINIVGASQTVTVTQPLSAGPRFYRLKVRVQ